MSMDTDDNEVPSGYIVYEMEKISDRFKCPYCHAIIKEAIQLSECGHRVCKACFVFKVKVNTTKNEMICPDPTCMEKNDETYMTDRAFQRELDKLAVECVYKPSVKCEWKGFLQSYKDHLSEAHTKFECDLCNQNFSNPKVLEQHKEKSCPELFMHCLLAPHCTEEMFPKANLKEHLLSERHQEIVALIASGKFQSDVAFEQESNAENQMDWESRIGAKESHIYEKLEGLSTIMQSTTQRAESMEQELIKALTDAECLKEKLNEISQRNRQKKQKLMEIQQEQLRAEEELEKAKKILDDTQFVSTDGTMVWRIDNVSKRIEAAQSDREPSLYSPIFYSSPNGYKMRLRLYLYGDGSARRTHVSLFFSLMKGEYDALLRWPFSYKVVFALLNQVDRNAPIIDSFRPDTKSNSFQRPTSENNIASGIPKFVAISTLQQDDNPFVRNNQMFIKVIVDVNDTPKAVIPYVITLNPGLPNHTRKNMIKDYIEKSKDSNSSGQDLKMS